MTTMKEPTLARRAGHSSRDQRVADAVSLRSPCCFRARVVVSRGLPAAAGIVRIAHELRLQLTSREAAGS